MSDDVVIVSAARTHRKAANMSKIAHRAAAAPVTMSSRYPCITAISIQRRDDAGRRDA